MSFENYHARAAAGSVLTLATHNLGEVMVVRCVGRMMYGYADRLRAVVKQARTRTVVLDLAETTAIDAAGLGVLVSLRNWAKATGTTFRLMNLRPEVEQLLERTRLKAIFAICSVPEMFDLLCRAMERGPSAGESIDVIPPSARVMATGGSAA